MYIGASFSCARCKCKRVTCTCAHIALMSSTKKEDLYQAYYVAIMEGVQDHNEDGTSGFWLVLVARVLIRLGCWVGGFGLRVYFCFGGRLRGSMKGHEAKMPRMEDILNLPVQDPPFTEFSAAHLNWVKVEGGRQGGDDIALIPYARVDNFVKGESGNAECPASFRVESRRKRPEGSVSKPRVDGYLKYTLCLCHFTVKRLYTRPLLALIIYNQRNHVDKTGAPCHGILDHDAVGTRAMYAPRISEELRQKVMSMLYVGISLDNVMQHHMEEVQRHGGPHNRDDFLTTMMSLHGNDECSVKMWVRHQKHVFFFQDNCGSEPFILGIQTDWQLQQMLHYGHNGSVASHSVFGLKKLKYPLCSLLVFDSSRNAIPVAWVITSCDVGQDIHKWMVSLVERIRTKDPRFRPNAFLVDDPSFETSIIREAFQCRVLVCLWHIRRLVKMPFKEMLQL
ncbi:hypothetical protein LOK49_LG03G02026 [Camellia lanceoleosa]|uniref:Uncharacterized protein n=1 Tax=Camellia lanceoleosa TaxID=1840588 RepID=A0ACC0IDG9_9ERIC|nr:hypothetical protein LOK49_LG03G02026 [Camellia lanceoleosa]